jgi:glycosyltransferase involved in cell wall biosynthesis
MRVAIWHPDDGLPRIPGGHRVQLVEVARQLTRLGHDVRLEHDPTPNLGGVDVVHGMGLSATQIGICHRRGVPVVVSPVYWPSTYHVPSSRLGSLVTRTRAGLGAFRSAWRRELLPTALRDQPRVRNLLLAMEAADHLLPNANGERQAIVDDLGVSTPATTVPNGADPEIFDAGPEPGARDAIVVCTGRIEPHKNQLKLIAAVRAMGIKLLLVGVPHRDHDAYYRRCLAAAERSDVEFVGWQPQEAQVEILNRAAVHVLPSWFETTGLVSLEAALAGAKIVSTERGYAREYLEDDAWYCDPASVRSVQDAITNALNAPWQPHLRDRILERYTWAHAAAATADGYRSAMS